MKKIIALAFIGMLFSCTSKKKENSNNIHTKTQTVTLNLSDKTTERNQATFDILKDLDFIVEFHPFANTSNFIAFSKLKKSVKDNKIKETFLYIVDQNQKIIQFKSSNHFKNFMTKKGYDFKDTKSSLTFTTYHFVKSNK